MGSYGATTDREITRRTTTQEKKYETPRLVRYGTLTEITQATGLRTKNSDNALLVLKTG